MKLDLVGLAHFHTDFRRPRMDIDRKQLPELETTEFEPTFKSTPSCEATRGVLIISSYVVLICFQCTKDVKADTSNMERWTPAPRRRHMLIIDILQLYLDTL